MLVADGHVRNAGVDPDVERVAALRVPCGRPSAAAISSSSSSNQTFVPLGHQLGDLEDRFRIEERLAFGGIEHGQRHAPGALARDAPVRAATRRCRRSGCGPTPAVHSTLVDLFERLAAQVVERDEELLDGAEDDRRFRAPAMRIGMLVNLVRPNKMPRSRRIPMMSVVRLENVTCRPVRRGRLPR